MRLPSSITRIRFWLEYACGVITDAPAWCMFVVTNTLRPKELRYSILITDVSGDADMDTFTASVADALELVKNSDERRFARIQHNIRSIIRMRKPSAARYLRFGEACLVNERKYPESPGPAMVLRLACTLVHASTYGYILWKQLPSFHFEKRHERICTQEVQRFLKRVKTQWAKEAAI